MNPIHYIKKNGIKHTWDVLYQYKINQMLVKILSAIYQKMPLKDIIIIESHNDFDCNGGAVYDYLLKRGYNKKYKIVWFLKNKKPDALPENVTSCYLFKPGLRKAYYICRAKYFLADNTVTDKVRADQVSIGCGHGQVALKNCKGLCAASDSVDYIMVPSVNFAPIFAEQVEVPYPNDRFIYLGHPCLDVLFQDTPDDFRKITTESFRKKILWMPTFRKGGGYNRSDSERELPLGIPLIESQEAFDRLNDFLEEQNILLVIKLHPMQDPSTYANLKETHNIRVLNGLDVKRLQIDNYRLMKGADAMLSDYSSSAFQYLLLNRPIGFVLSDLKDYRLGLCVDNVDDYLVGHRIFGYDDFVQFFKDVAEGKDEYVQQRVKLADWLFDNCNGSSAEQLVKFMGL